MKNVFKKAVSLTIALSTVAALSVSAFAAYDVEQDSGAITVNVGDSLDSVSVATVAGEGIVPYTTSGAGQYAVAVVAEGFAGSGTEEDNAKIYYVNQAADTGEVNINTILANMLLKGAIELNKDYEVRIGTNATVDGEAVALTSIPFRVVEKANEPQILYGDVNGDGEVLNADKTVLSRHLLGWPAYAADKINYAAADVNGDGEVLNADKTVLSRHLLGWPAYATLPYSK